MNSHASHARSLSDLKKRPAPASMTFRSNPSAILRLSQSSFLIRGSGACSAGFQSGDANGVPAM